MSDVQEGAPSSSALRLPSDFALGVGVHRSVTTSPSSSIGAVLLLVGAAAGELDPVPLPTRAGLE